MARISFPERGLGEHVDWALLRPEMGMGMGALSEAVYGNTKLALRGRYHFPIHLILIEAVGALRGLTAYRRSARRAKRIAAKFPAPKPATVATPMKLAA